MIGDPDYAHGWVNAKSGAGKSRTVGYPSLLWNVKAGATVVYTARKLTEYKLTAEALESDGVRALLLDLEKPKRGVRLNLMDAVNERVDRGDVAAAQRAARQLAADFVKSDEKNPYFSNAARALLAAAVLVVSMECPERDARNLASVAGTLRAGLTGGGKDPASPLKDYVRSLGQDHPAYKTAAEFLQDNGSTAGRNVVSTLMTGITVLGDEGIEWMLSGSDVTLRQLAEEQCVLMPHCLGEGDPYNVVLSAMYNQLWATLQEVAAERGERLPRPFVILGDEWGNLPRVECLGEMVSLGRSMDLHVFVFVQNMSQLEKYNDPGDNGAGMDKLLGSMNLQVAMSVMKARPDGEYFSSLCGKRTVRARTQGTSVQGAGLGSRGGSSDSCIRQWKNRHFALQVFDTSLPNAATFPSLDSRLPEHQRGIHPPARAVELDQPSMVDQPVDRGGGELVVAEHRAPLAELDVGGDDHAPLLVAAAHDLEQQPRPLDAQRHVAELVEDDEVRPGDVPQHRLQRVLPARPRQHEHELGRAEEAHGPAGLHARVADRYRQVGLAPPGLAVEHEVLRRVHERERHEVLGPVPLRERDLGEVVALERLDLGEGGLPVEPLALVALADGHLAPDQVGRAPDLGGGGAGEERLDGLVREEHPLGERAEALGVALAPGPHA